MFSVDAILCVYNRYCVYIYMQYIIHIIIHNIYILYYIYYTYISYIYIYYTYIYYTYIYNTYIYIHIYIYIIHLYYTSMLYIYIYIIHIIYIYTPKKYVFLQPAMHGPNEPSPKGLGPPRQREEFHQQKMWIWTPKGNKKLVGGFNPSENISQWEGLSHILWKIKNVPNHQPENLDYGLNWQKKGKQ